MFDPMEDEKYPTPHVEEISVRRLRVDLTVQRNIDWLWIDKHEPAFNVAYLGVVTVSLRADGTYHLIDGQHRVELTRRVLGPDQPIWCEVYEGLSSKQEARMFLDRNDRKTIGTYDKFRISIAAEDEVACAIVSILQGRGLSHSAQRKAGHVNAVAALQRVFTLTDKKTGSRVGGLALTRALHVLKESWGDASSSFEGHLIEGLGRFYARYGSKVETDALIRKLSSRKGGAAVLLGNARALRDYKHKSVSLCVASIVTDEYNRGRRSGSLGDWWAKG